MKNLLREVGIIVFVVIVGFSIAGCGDDDGGNNNSNNNNNNGNNNNDDKTLTGTVTVTEDVVISSSLETMKLTADTSDLNGGSIYQYQWIRDNENIENATSKTYSVTFADYGKTLKVKVTYTGLSGEQFGEFVVPNPTIMNVTVKWSDQVITGVTNNVSGFSYKSIIFRRQDDSHFGSTFGTLGQTPVTVTLTSWSENKFKMLSMFDTVEYFYKNGTGGPLLFDLTNGVKTYRLNYIKDYNDEWSLTATLEN